MGYMVIKQPLLTHPTHPEEPYQLYAIFSSYSDTWVRWNHTREDVVQWFVDGAVRDATRQANELLNDLDEENGPRKVYHQFAMTWEKVNELSREHGGPVLDDQGQLMPNADGVYYEGAQHDGAEEIISGTQEA